MVLILIFLYAPILTMMVLSFNKSKSRTQWGGFTLQWYTQMFDSRSIMSALTTTLIIAFVSALVATTVFAFTYYNMKKPFSLGACISPLLGERATKGRLADIIDALCIFILCAGMSGSLSSRNPVNFCFPLPRSAIALAAPMLGSLNTPAARK